MNLLDTLRKIATIDSSGGDLDPGRLVEVLNKLGNPERKLAPAFHVCGTNGKGSVTAFLKSILQAEGYLVNVFTSPHLHCVNERICLSDKGGASPISTQAFFEVAKEVQAVSKDLPITFFEVITACAILSFASQQANFCIFEVGLGGRLDATNVLTNLAGTLVTRIGLDHQQWLGDSVEEIAREKVGILKSNIPCFSSKQEESASRVIKSRSDELGCSLFVEGIHWNYQKEYKGWCFSDMERHWNLPLPKLVGAHQLQNAALSIATLLGTCSISLESVKKGLGDVAWPGRLQHITSGKLFNSFRGEDEVWIDGAHNVLGAETLAAELLDNKKEVVLVLSVLKRKEIQPILKVLLPVCSRLIGLDILDNGHSSELIREVTMELGSNSDCAKSIDQALYLARSYPSNNKGKKIVFTGSLMMVAKLLEYNQ